MHNRFLVTILLFAALLIGARPAFCSAKKIDLDDGIEIDDSIDDYHELGKIQSNISYIIMNAMSSAQIAATNSAENINNYSSENVSDSSGNSSGNSAESSSKNGSKESLNDNYSENYTVIAGDSYTKSQKTGGSFSSINTINIGPGTVINGDVILIDKSQGGHTAISQ